MIYSCICTTSHRSNVYIAFRLTASLTSTILMIFCSVLDCSILLAQHRCKLHISQPSSYPVSFLCCATYILIVFVSQQGRLSPRTGTSSKGSTKGDGVKKSESPTSPGAATSADQNAATSLLLDSVNREAMNADDPRTTSLIDIELGAASEVERRGTLESKPVHAPSNGFLDGGPNFITKIEELNEGENT